MHSLTSSSKRALHDEIKLTARLNNLIQLDLRYGKLQDTNRNTKRLQDVKNIDYGYRMPIAATHFLKQRLSFVLHVAASATGEFSTVLKPHGTVRAWQDFLSGLQPLQRSNSMGPCLNSHTQNTRIACMTLKRTGTRMFSKSTLLFLPSIFKANLHCNHLTHSTLKDFGLLRFKDHRIQDCTGYLKRNVRIKHRSCCL